MAVKAEFELRDSIFDYLLKTLTFLERTNVARSQSNSDAMDRRNLLSWFLRIIGFETCLKIDEINDY